MKMLMITEMCIFRKHLDICKIFLNDEVTRHTHKQTHLYRQETGAHWITDQLSLPISLQIKALGMRLTGQ
jgi:hypothetical protein